MNSSQQEDGGRERQRPSQHQQQHPAAAAPENIFTNIYNVIAGARESASQEFTRFWESLGHAQRPYYSSPPSAAIQSRKIKTPTSLRNKQFSRNGSINGRFLPDDNVRGIVKDVEIQTDDDLLQPSSLSIPSKRSASSTFEEYHIPFPVKGSSKKTSFSLAERDASFERPAFLSRRIDTTSNDDLSDQPSAQEQQQEQEAVSVSNKDKEPSQPQPPPPPPAAPSPPALPSTSSLSPMRAPIRKAMSLSPNRPLSSSTSRAASVGRFTPSPNRDIRTGSKSVRRLTMELESQFSPKFPSSRSPKRQRQESTQEATVASSPQNDRQGESSLSPASHYRSELAATLATQAQAASAAMTTHTMPTKPLQPSPKAPEAEEQQQQQNITANKDEEDYYANLLKQKELDERVNKLEKQVSIARTRVSEFSAENSGGSDSSNSRITSPIPSHTIMSPGRSSIPVTPATPSAHPYKTANTTSPVREARVSTSPYRSSTLVSSLQQPAKEASFSPPSMSYAAAKAAIQEAVGRKGTASPFRERISSVRSTTMSRPVTPVPPAPPQPPQLSAPSSSSSPSRASSSSSSSYKEASTYYPPKHTPSPYLQQPSNGITQLKPNDQHKSKMKEVIKMIPHFNLRKADTIM